MAVAFYRLTKKFVDDARSIPQEAGDVLYYTLAVGHHTGVIDCFEERMRYSMERYEALTAAVAPGHARFKLEGIMRFGEITVDKACAPELSDAVRATLDAELAQRPQGSQGCSQTASDLAELADALEEVRNEPHVYLVGRSLA